MERKSSRGELKEVSAETGCDEIELDRYYISRTPFIRHMSSPLVGNMIIGICRLKRDELVRIEKDEPVDNPSALENEEQDQILKNWQYDLELDGIQYVDELFHAEDEYEMMKILLNYYFISEFYDQMDVTKELNSLRTAKNTVLASLVLTFYKAFRQGIDLSRATNTYLDYEKKIEKSEAPQTVFELISLILLRLLWAI